MFENYSEIARGALFVARREAGRLGIQRICSEHLLIGLVTVHPHFFEQTVLIKMEPEEIRNWSRRWHAPSEPIPDWQDVGMARELRPILMRAELYASRFLPKEVRTEHLFLSLLEEDCHAAQFLALRGSYRDFMAGYVENATFSRRLIRRATDGDAGGYSVTPPDSVSEFVAAVSHEFRSSLTTLRLVTDMLIEGRVPDDSTRRESYLHLGRETARLDRLVDDLLDFRQMQSGRKQYQLARHDAFHLARKAIADISEQARTNGFHIESNFLAVKGRKSVTIQVDGKELTRALRILLENAMKYSPDCRTIWVNGTVEGNQVCISVRDKGMGIDPDDLNAIFRKFVRSEAAKKAGIKGTGIGLTMAREIVKAMHGEIRLKSKVGVGSTFAIILPLANSWKGFSWRRRFS